MIHHDCGLMGISNHEEAARLTYFGLYAQQHRGQESAGIATYDGIKIHEHKGMGLVPDVFCENDFVKLKGRSAIGHVRYSTAGVSQLRNAQPFVVNFQGMNISLAHNGNLVNTHQLRTKLEKRGVIFHASNDSEIFVHLLVRALRKNSLEDALRYVCSKVQGAYCLLVQVNGKMVAIRDPYGFHPLSMASLDGSIVFASETCAFDLLEAKFIRTVEPGEMVIVEGNTVQSKFIFSKTLPKPKFPKQCIFELVYFARPDSNIFDENVYLARKRMGWQLAHESTPDVDFVMPFPDSGVYSAVGFAQCAELPYEHAMIRNHYVGRTFIQPTQSMRNFSVRIKINPVHEMIEGKRICIVDDSIVRGTTMTTRVKKLRDLGAREVHIRISCPPVKFPCYYGIDFASKGQLVAATHSIPEIKKLLNVDSIHYLSLKGLLRSVNHENHYCTACFTGEYPIRCTDAEMGCLTLNDSCASR